MTEQLLTPENAIRAVLDGKIVESRWGLNEPWQRSHHSDSPLIRIRGIATLGDTRQYRVKPEPVKETRWLVTTSCFGHATLNNAKSARIHHYAEQAAGIIRIDFEDAKPVSVTLEDV